MLTCDFNPLPPLYNNVNHVVMLCYWSFLRNDSWRVILLVTTLCQYWIENLLLPIYKIDSSQIFIDDKSASRKDCRGNCHVSISNRALGPCFTSSSWSLTVWQASLHCLTDKSILSDVERLLFMMLLFYFQV